jgi:CheY-like chemotaxis protein
MSKPTILLVEDNPEDVSFLQRALAKAGLSWNLRVADDGQKAIEELSAPQGAGASSEPPTSHVILDLKLPRKSGLEVLAWIRAHPRWKSVPVIVLTSSEVNSDVQGAQSLGIDAYLVKPLTLKGLMETVQQIAATWKLPGPGTASA